MQKMMEVAKNLLYNGTNVRTTLQKQRTQKGFHIWTITEAIMSRMIWTIP